MLTASQLSTGLGAGPPVPAPNIFQMSPTTRTSREARKVTSPHLKIGIWFYYNRPKTIHETAFLVPTLVTSCYMALWSSSHLSIQPSAFGPMGSCYPIWSCEDQARESTPSILSQGSSLHPVLPASTFPLRPKCLYWAFIQTVYSLLSNTLLIKYMVHPLAPGHYGKRHVEFEQTRVSG